MDLLLEQTLILVHGEGRDLSLRQIAILLVYCHSEEGLTVGRLPQHLKIVKASVSRSAERPETAGLVIRKSDPRDRRSVLIMVTPAGPRYQAQCGDSHRESSVNGSTEADARPVASLPPGES